MQKPGNCVRDHVKREFGLPEACNTYTYVVCCMMEVVLRIVSACKQRQDSNYRASTRQRAGSPDKLRHTIHSCNFSIPNTEHNVTCSRPHVYSASVQLEMEYTAIESHIDCIMAHQPALHTLKQA